MRRLYANQSALFSWLVECAEQGLPCPRNSDIAARFHFSTDSTCSGMVSALERVGMITVERYQQGRRITIVDTGKSTAAVPNARPHWRHRSPQARIEAGEVRRAVALKAPHCPPEAAFPASSPSLPAPTPVVPAMRQRKPTALVPRRAAPISPALREDRAARLAAGDLSDAEPNEIIQYFDRIWPAMWGRAKRIAAEMGWLPGEALFRALSAGLQCLDEADAEPADQKPMKECQA